MSCRWSRWNCLHFQVDKPSHPQSGEGLYLEEIRLIFVYGGYEWFGADANDWDKNFKLMADRDGDVDFRDYLCLLLRALVER